MSLLSDDLVARATALFDELALLDRADRIETLNALRLALHEHSPFAAEPVDCVVWAPAERVAANDYNPNSVAPPEMRLLEHSIVEDGYTQPIVAWATADAEYEVVDGFHRQSCRPGVRCGPHPCRWLPAAEHRQQ